jgi:hypothetical protein
MKRVANVTSQVALWVAMGAVVWVAVTGSCAAAKMRVLVDVYVNDKQSSQDRPHPETPHDRPVR